MNTRHARFTQIREVCLATLILTGFGWLGTTVNTRLRSLDAIPFKKSLHLDMEVWTHDSSGSVQKYVDYGVATYWYGFPGTRGNWVSAPVRKQP